MTSFSPGEAHALRCELATETLLSSGCLRLQVMGWSMLPAVRPGDVLIIHAANLEQVSAGDIVLFGRDRRLFAHRVVKKNGAYGDASLLCRGDSLRECDAPVSGNELLGKVVRISRNKRTIAPRRRLRMSERAVAALVQHSAFGARVVVRFLGIRSAPAVPQVSNLSQRAVSCQN
jgi:signal peptidase I